MKRTALAIFLLLAALCLPSLAADVYEPKPGSPERAAMMDALRAPISKAAGTRLTFTGHMRVSGEWGVFGGHAAPTDGKPGKGGPDVDLELDLLAVLRKSGDDWKVVFWRFAGDVSGVQDARKQFPKIPRELLRD